MHRNSIFDLRAAIDHRLLNSLNNCVHAGCARVCFWHGKFFQMTCLRTFIRRTLRISTGLVRETSFYVEWRYPDDAKLWHFCSKNIQKHFYRFFICLSCRLLVYLRLYKYSLISFRRIYEYPSLIYFRYIFLEDLSRSSQLSNIYTAYLDDESARGTWKFPVQAQLDCARNLMRAISEECLSISG